MDEPGSERDRRAPIDIEQGIEEDPLASLYQIEYVESTPLWRKAVVLVTRLLENIEESYTLREQIINAMVVEEKAEDKIVDLFNALIEGLRVEQSFLGRVDLIP
ncbi:MAG: hypothetical protein NWE79_05410 [Candidatus Bathyarchaeota archaeon]|nr:hypothetical protein [Candidatus Bathyarchaeota archaeon]